MKHWFPVLLALPLIGLAFVLGAFNAEPVSLDLVLFQLHWPLGVVLMMALGLGMLLMAVVLYLVRILPLQYQLRRCQRAQKASDPGRELQLGD